MHFVGHLTWNKHRTGKAVFSRIVLLKKMGAEGQVVRVGAVVEVLAGQNAGKPANQLRMKNLSSQGFSLVDRGDPGAVKTGGIQQSKQSLVSPTTHPLISIQKSLNGYFTRGVKFS